MKFIQINPGIRDVKWTLHKKKIHILTLQKGLHQTVVSHGKGVIFTKLMFCPISSNC